MKSFIGAFLGAALGVIVGAITLGAIDIARSPKAPEGATGDGS